MTRRLGLALWGVLVATGFGEAQAPVPLPWASTEHPPPVPGPWSALMKAAIEHRTVDVMVAFAAFTTSREP